MTPEEIRRALRGRYSKAQDAIGEAVRLGSLGDELLADALSRRADSLIAAALGQVEGPAGEIALRKAAESSGPGSQDVRCAALLALAKRNPDGSATPELIEGLASRDWVVRWYAMVGLAGAGDDRAWEPAFARLVGWLRQASTNAPYDWTLCYLAQCVASGGPRSVELVETVRHGWTKLGLGAGWIAAQWPAAAPSGPGAGDVPAPDGHLLRMWARNDSLFKAHLFP
jgi:hypothetical protein